MNAYLGMRYLMLDMSAATRSEEHPKTLLRLAQTHLVDALPGPKRNFSPIKTPLMHSLEVCRKRLGQSDCWLFLDRQVEELHTSTIYK